MALGETFDLGRIIAQAEGIKGLRQQSEDSLIRRRYMENADVRATEDQQFQRQQVAAQTRQQAVGQIGALAQQALQSPNPQQFVAQALQSPQYAPIFQQAGVDPSKLDLNDPNFAASLQTWASFGPKQEAFTLKEGEARFVNGKQVAAVDAKPETISPYQQESLANERRRIALAEAEAAARRGDGEKKIRKDVQQLRKEFRSLPSVKEYETVLPLITSAERAPDTPQGDLQLIYTVGKILDPGSVVREGELQLTANAAPFLQQAIGRARKEAGKGRLTPQTRKDMLNMLNQRVEGYRESYERDRQQYSQYAQEAELDPSQVVGQPRESRETSSSGTVKRVRVDAQGNVVQ